MKHLITILLFLSLSSCSLHSKGTRKKEELAPYMSSLQRYTQKLGYSIKNRNLKLSDFYLHEIEETLEEIEENFPTYDGLPIAQTTKAFMHEPAEALEEAIKKEAWKASDVLYSNLIKSCNGCHVANQHEFIKILEPQGLPPFNQKF